MTETTVPTVPGPPSASIPGAQLHQVATGGLRWAVWRAGPTSSHEPPVLLLHGVPETALSWRDLVPELARDRQVIVPDLPGLGGTEAPASFDVPALVEALAALVLHEVDGAADDGSEGSGRQVDVVGHDWGGILALALAAARPDLVRRLVVANAPYRRVGTRALHVPFFALPGLPELAFAAGGQRMAPLMVRLAWRSKPPLAPEVLDAYAQAYGDSGHVRAMLGYYRAAVRGRLTPWQGERPGPVTARTMVLWGALDPVLPLSVGEAAVADLGPQTRLVTVPHAGHFVVEEAPDVAVPAVAGFLRE